MNENSSTFVSSLYAAYFAERLQQKPFMFEGTRLLRRGPSSLAFADNERVIKIIVANHHFVMPVKKEFELLKELEGIKGDQFILPQALDWGNNPDYIVMSNIGSRLAAHPDRFLKASAAMGEFAGKIWAYNRLIHTDIHVSNFTVPNRGDDKIGIIDLAAIETTQTPEEMFWCPLLRQEISCPVIAKIFTKTSGVSIDFDRVKSIADKRLPEYMRTTDLAHAQAVKEIVTNNLMEWKASLLSHHPVLPVSHKNDLGMSL